MREPKVSVLCVTENRAAFMPWLEWNWRRQEYENRELILVSSDLTQPERLSAFDSYGVAQVAAANNVHVVFTAARGIGKKLQTALDLATGEYVMIWCDDDWQHPQRIRRSLELDADIVGWNTGYFMDLHNEVNAAVPRVSLYENRTIQAVAASALVRTEVARRAAFLDEPAEDTRWLERVLATKPSVCTMHWWPFSLWLVHGKNTVPRGYQFFDYKDQPDPARRVLDELIHSPHWTGTPKAMEDLRCRLRSSSV